MSITLRIILIVLSIFSFALCVKRIKQSKLRIENSVGWMIGCVVLILMSIFSNFITWISSKLGFISPANFVFLVIIGFLLIQNFTYNIRVSELNEKVKNLDHYIALKEYEEEKSGGKDGKI